MENSKIIGLIYTLFVGLLIAIFIGVGIDVFYPGPKSPTYEAIYQEESESVQTARQKDYDNQYNAYVDESNSYNRNLSVIVLISAVVLLLVSFYFEKRVKVLPDGIMLGGLFTLIYSVIRGFISTDSRVVFAIVLIGLIAVLYIGYHRFARIEKKTKKQKR